MKGLVPYLQPIRRRMGVRFVLDRDPDHRKSVFLAGMGRSGGTWVGEIINQRNEYRYIFEPFHPKHVPWVEPFPPRTYMRPDENDPELLEVARSIVTGQIRHPWTERFNRRFIADRRLIKEIYANLMLKWLHVNFEGMPVILVLRHPCAVAASYVTHGYRGAVVPLLEQPKLVEDFLHPYVEEIKGAGDTFERAVFLWCVETLVPLKQFRPEEVHIVFFENMVRQPESEVEKLFAYMGKRPESVDIGKLKQPSLTSRRASSAAWTGDDRVTAWQKKVSEAQRRRAVEILELFGLERIYTDEPLPRVEGLRELMNGGGEAGQRAPSAPSGAAADR